MEVGSRGHGAAPGGGSGLAAGGTACSQRRNVLSTDDSGTACFQLLLWNVLIFYLRKLTSFTLFGNRRPILEPCSLWQEKFINFSRLPTHFTNELEEMKCLSLPHRHQPCQECGVFGEGVCWYWEGSLAFGLALALTPLVLLVFRPLGPSQSLHHSFFWVSRLLAVDVRTCQPPKSSEPIPHNK